MKNDYKKLRLKLVLYLLIATFLAVVVQEILISIDGTTKIITRNELYGPFLMVRFSLILFISFYFVVTRIVKLFNQISDEMDKLLKDSEQPIVLGPELASLQGRLNMINATLKERKKAANASEQRKNDLVVYLAHDIKTPLTSVIGYLSLLNEAPDMPMEQKSKYVEITLEKANRLDELINEFFEITRFELQTIDLNKGKINLTFMLQQIADEFYPMLMAERKQVSVNSPEGLTLWGDADKLARVFNNILKNAIAYSYDNSIIDISAVQNEKNIVITFTNKGDAIPLQKLNTIFEKFYRLDSSRSSNTGGAGLGLAIAKDIVEAHGGTITVQSNEKFTVFTVTFPFDT